MRGLTVLALATGLLAVGAPAHAADPERTAWYSATNAGPLVVPAPTLAEGDLRVAGAGARPTAYTTLLLTSPGTSGGELVLAVRGTPLGTPDVAACPTKTSTWEAGGNQPFEQGPEYDCAAGTVFGTVAEDGASIAFLLDSSVQPAAGTVSLALVPLPEGTVPFQVDLGDPEYTPAETGQPAPAPASEPSAPAPAPAAPALAAGSADVAPAPPVQEADAPPPALAPADVPLADAGPAPALPAPEAAVAPAAPAAVLPGATLAAGTPEDDDGPRLLALLALVGVSVTAGYAAGQQRPAPRLLGGRARSLPAAGAAAAVAVVEVPREQQPRGIGRFSRVRDAAPRSLR